MIKIEIISENKHSQLQYKVNEFTDLDFVKEVIFMQFIKEDDFLTAIIVYDHGGEDDSST